YPLPEFRALVEAEMLRRTVGEVESVGVGAFGRFGRAPRRVRAAGKMPAIEIVRPVPVETLVEVGATRDPRIVEPLVALGTIGHLPGVAIHSEESLAVDVGGGEDRDA